MRPHVLPEFANACRRWRDAEGCAAEVGNAESVVRDPGRCGPEVEEKCAALRLYPLIRDALTNVGLVMDCTYMRYAQHLCQLKSRSVWGTHQIARTANTRLYP